ncbi:MAG: hypothetical protein GQ581_04770 [Methyloprofundus sp.]|nr:hypothetical protein [Methyloprofundus sp.]
MSFYSKNLSNNLIGWLNLIKMNEIKNNEVSELEEKIGFFNNHYHRLCTESVMEMNPIAKYSIEKNMKEALAQKEEAENILHSLGKKESRNEQYLRILPDGVNGESDYEAVKYLKSKGYTDSPIQISKGRDSYGKVINIVWQGANFNGLDFINNLKETKARNITNDSKVIQNKINKETDAWYKKPFGIIFLCRYNYW